MKWVVEPLTLIREVCYEVKRKASRRNAMMRSRFKRCSMKLGERQAGERL